MFQTLLKIAVAASVALFMSSAVQAGGFHIRGYSTIGLGAAFAGIAAGNYLSSVFSNSAGISVVEGLEAEADGTLIVTDSHISGTATFEPAPPFDTRQFRLQRSRCPFSIQTVAILSALHLFRRCMQACR